MRREPKQGTSEIEEPQKRASEKETPISEWFKEEEEEEEEELKSKLFRSDKEKEEGKGMRNGGAENNKGRNRRIIKQALEAEGEIVPEEESRFKVKSRS